MKILPFVLLTSAVFSGMVAAQDVQLAGTITQPLDINSLSFQPEANTPSAIKLLKIQLSDKAHRQLLQHVDTVDSQAQGLLPVYENDIGNSKIELGMNDVPVLDQGMHGSCVTFAATAAIDALIGQGDYVSQLCQLQLGNYLAKNGYQISGWNGSFGHLVLAQITTFGLINKQQESTIGCGDLQAYPLTGDDPTSDISVEAFHPLSESLRSHDIRWYSILSSEEAFTTPFNPNTILEKVKNSLKDGDRLVFGTLLIDLNQGIAGAVGRYHVKNDTWVLTEKMKQDLKKTTEFAAHELVITGYDDNAIAQDNTGYKHRGLLTLRNSWGRSIGDAGTFYMSYDFFKTMVMEVTRIRKMNKV